MTVSRRDDGKWTDAGLTVDVVVDVVTVDCLKGVREREKPGNESGKPDLILSKRVKS